MRKKKENKERTEKWKIGDLLRMLLNIVKAIFNGTLLTRLKVDKLFPHIAYVFFLLMMLILFDLMVDNTLSKVKENDRILSELNVEYTQKSYELVKLNRRSTVEGMLIDLGSDIREPQQPPVELK